MENTLLTANATLPTYDRSALIPRIVHLGFGAFHRAHQAVYARYTGQRARQRLGLHRS